MSSSPSPQQDRMLAQQRAHEPSMEEILASIRRIIADDSAAAVETPVAEPPRPAPAFRSAAVRETAFRDATQEAEPAKAAPLAPDRPANLEAAPAPRLDGFGALTARLGGARPAPERGFDVGEAIIAAASEDVLARNAPPAAAEPAQVGSAQVGSAQVGSAQVGSAQVGPTSVEPAPMLSREADAAVAAQFGKLSDALMANNAQRLDEMARQMLRPLLKSWLDDNLPVLVERLVRAEIERVARGGR